MKKRRVSLKDLADELGVSMATVSRALNGSHEVGEEMRQRVNALAKERNYKPNPFAQGLRKEAPRIIGVIVPNFVTHYFASILDGIERYASKLGYSVFSANSHESCELEKKAIDNFVSLHVDGIMVCLAQDTTDFQHIDQLHEQGIPVVLFTRTCLPEKFSTVIANDVEASFEATKHLLDSGFRRIAFIGCPNHLDIVTRRKHGYLQALKEAGIPIDRSLIVCDKIDFGKARELTINLITSENPPDAILAFNDIISFAAFDAIKSLGKRIPEDVAIVGFAESETATFLTPKLSIIKDQAVVQGARACELLMRQINGDTKIYKEVIPMRPQFSESSEKK